MGLFSFLTLGYIRSSRRASKSLLIMKEKIRKGLPYLNILSLLKKLPIFQLLYRQIVQNTVRPFDRYMQYLVLARNAIRNLFSIPFIRGFIN